MKMINSRNKGHSYEREVVRLLRRVFDTCERSQEGSSFDRNGVDIIGTGSLRIQCKRGRKYAPISKIDEIKIEGISVLWTKGDRKKDVVCLYAEDFLKIIQDIGVIYED